MPSCNSQTQLQDPQPRDQLQPTQLQSDSTHPTPVITTMPPVKEVGEILTSEKPGCNFTTASCPGNSPPAAFVAVVPPSPTVYSLPTAFHPGKRTGL
ncbi:hypothetical protein PG993_002584 [Apiospora rasikravindrae]|uniref:Uncharacterized protein n=1 Tax=Apiospora rasikravindrae TaxID=990691 RepID=A0ABR1TZS5_9PEZI